MNLELSTYGSHPNRIPFKGVLTFLDIPSAKPPSGARSRLVRMSSLAAQSALPSIIGMAINFSNDGQRHEQSRKIGLITEAEISEGKILVSGFVWGRDFPGVVESIAASVDSWGMSYEISDCHIEDIRSKVWNLMEFTFTGAAVINRKKAAYENTEFYLQGAE